MSHGAMVKSRSGNVSKPLPQCPASLPAAAEDAVGTTGYWDISPNAVNSVPRVARLEIDVRDIDGARRDATVASILEKVRAAV